MKRKETRVGVTKNVLPKQKKTVTGLRMPKNPRITTPDLGETRQRGGRNRAKVGSQ